MLSGVNPYESFVVIRRLSGFSSKTLICLLLFINLSVPALLSVTVPKETPEQLLIMINSHFFGLLGCSQEPSIIHGNVSPA